jgi:hypothetical protein
MVVKCRGNRRVAAERNSSQVLCMRLECNGGEKVQTRLAFSMGGRIIEARKISGSVLVIAKEEI